MKAVHLPFYDDNLYQTLLMEGLERSGVQTVHGGGGGTFGRVALREWKPDIMHFHWLHPYMIGPTRGATWKRSLLFLAQVTALKARGTKIVWTAHNLQSHESANPRLERALQKRFLRKCDAILAHCECAKADIVRIFGVPKNKIWVVPHGNYIGAYPNEISRENAREKLGLPPRAPVFLFLGQIRPYKGVLELVAAFQTLLQQLPPEQEKPFLLIAGKPLGDNASEEIRAAISDANQIRFTPGFVPDDALQDWMNASDMVVFPYRDILTSGAVLLAMSYGRACIAARRGCIAETLDEKGGFLYEPNDVDALLNALRAALNAGEKLPAMGAHNETLAQGWNWDSVATQTRTVYDYVTAK